MRTSDEKKRLLRTRWEIFNSPVPSNAFTFEGRTLDEQFDYILNIIDSEMSAALEGVRREVEEFHKELMANSNHPEQGWYEALRCCKKSVLSLPSLSQELPDK